LTVSVKAIDALGAIFTFPAITIVDILKGGEKLALFFFLIYLVIVILIFVFDSGVYFWNTILVVDI